MGKVLFTKKTPFDMRDWEKRNNILEVYAGMNCIMARCLDGSVLRKCLAGGRVLNTYTGDKYLQAGSFSSDDEELHGWNNVQQISISVQYPGLAIGVTKERKCVALLPLSKIEEADVTDIVEFISGLSEVVEISATNDLFVLTSDGKVHQWTFPSIRSWSNEIIERSSYQRCSTWKNIAHIHAGNQAICGITKDGIAMLSYPWDNNLKRAEKYENAHDVFPAGSDNENRYIALNNGDLISSRSKDLLNNNIDKLIGCVYEVLALTKDQRLKPISYILAKDEIKDWKKIISVAIGLRKYSPESVFLLAVTEDQNSATTNCNESAIDDYENVGKELKDEFNCNFNGYYGRHFRRSRLADGSTNAEWLYVDCNKEEIYEYTRIHVPKDVGYHSRGNFYWPPNLQEIIAHPDSPYYYSYDGALYRKNSGDLACVPLGKRILHLEPKISIRQIFFYPYIYDSLPNLEEIVIDGESESLSTHKGSLFSRDLKKLYYAPRKSKILYLAKETESLEYGALGDFSLSVNSNKPDPFRKLAALNIEAIEVEDGNPLFSVKNNCLFSTDYKHLYYAPKRGRHLFVAKETEVIDDNVLMNQYDTIEIESGNQFFTTRQGGLFTLDYSRMLIAPAQGNDLLIPKETKDVFPGVFHSSYDSIIVENGNPFYKVFMGFLLKKGDKESNDPTLRFMIGKTGNFSILDYEIVTAYNNEAHDIENAFVRFHASGEIKPGTEIQNLGVFLSYRDCFFGGRPFRLNAYRVLTTLIEKDEIEWMNRVIEDNRLITRRNISRLIRFSENYGSREMKEMLLGLKNLPEKIEAV